MPEAIEKEPSAKPIVPWTGGKRRLAGQILPLFPKHICYVEPFAGGAALFFLKEPSKAEVLNDINGELVNLYRVVKNHLEEFLRQFKWALTSRKIYEWSHATPPEVLTDVQRAARFFYIQRLNFAGLPRSRTYACGTRESRAINLLRIEETLSAAHLRLSQANLESLPWEKCVERYDREETFFYMDPPYLGSSNDYGFDFPPENYQRMAELLGTMKGKAIVSLSDCREVRRTFKGFKMRSVSITYTPGAGSAGKGAKARELIIRNFWEPPAARLLLYGPRPPGAPEWPAKAGGTESVPAGSDSVPMAGKRAGGSIARPGGRG